MSIEETPQNALGREKTKANTSNGTNMYEWFTYRYWFFVICDCNTSRGNNVPLFGRNIHNASLPTGQIHNKTAIYRGTLMYGQFELW